MPPEVAAFDHRDGSLSAGCALDRAALIDDDGAHGRTLGQSLVDDQFKLDLGAAAVADVLRHDDGALRVVDTIDDGLRSESAKDDGVHRADAGAGEQRNGELGRHAHVDGHAIAFAHAERFEHIGEALDLVEQHGVGQGTDLAGLTLPEQGRPCPGAGRRRGDRRSCVRG